MADNKNNFLIYALQSPKKRHNLYVGQTKDYANRMKRHQKEDSGCIGISRAIQKYKWENIKEFVLIEGLSKEQADYWEKHYISIFDSFHNGYNLTAGGDGGATMTGRKHTEKTKAKQSASGKRMWQDPEYKANRAAAYERPEVKAKMSTKKMGDNNPSKRLEVRAKNSAAAMGNKNALGYKHTDEFRAVRSAAYTGQNNPMSIPNRRRRFIAKCFDNKIFLWD